MPAIDEEAEPASEEQTALRISDDVIPGTTGHLVLAEGRDEHDAPALAVWQLTPTGLPCGAWIVPTATLAGDAEAAARLLGLARGRALLAWDAAAARETLGRLAGWAGVRAPSPRPEVLLGAALTEVAARRAACDAAVEEYRATSKSTIAPLSWPRDVPAADSWEGFVTEAGIRTPGAVSPVAGAALRLARAGQWVADLWRDTETARTRRRYLVDRFGPAAALPPGWLDTLTAAHQQA